MHSLGTLTERRSGGTIIGVRIDASHLLLFEFLEDQVFDLAQSFARGDNYRDSFGFARGVWTAPSSRRRDPVWTNVRIFNNSIVRDDERFARVECEFDCGDGERVARVFGVWRKKRQKFQLQHGKAPLCGLVLSCEAKLG